MEDEDGSAEQLQEFLSQYEREMGVQIKCERFRDGDEIAENYKGNFDIILMDIQMRFMDGMTAAEKIRGMDRKVVIVFITNRIDYAIRGYAVVRVRTDDIFYVESEGHVLIYHTRNGDYRTRGKMGEIEEEFGSLGFFRSNKGYLVNLMHIEGVDGNFCLVGNTKLLISRARKNDFMAALAEYIGTT